MSKEAVLWTPWQASLVDVGDRCSLDIVLTDEVEVWLSKLRDSVCKTIHEMNIGIIQDCNNGVPMDEWPAKVVYQTHFHY